MQPSKSDIIAILGPPLAGKSTLGAAYAAEGDRFSVRSHFEPLRRLGAPLPPLGTILPGPMVWGAAEAFLNAQHGGGPCVLDGFPTTRGQFARLARWSTRRQAILTYIWLDITRSTARSRAMARRVCDCDARVDDARGNPTSMRCVRCGAQLVRRIDDTEAGFEARWNSYARRAPRLRRLAPISMTLDGEKSWQRRGLTDNLGGGLEVHQQGAQPSATGASNIAYRIVPNV
jgi:adenylate kinase family enzyme